MKKEFIRDGKKIRNCDSNVAKMNLLEVVLYACPCSIDWRECLRALGAGLVAPFVIATFPIWIFFSAYVKRKRAREAVQAYNAQDNKGL